MRVLINYETEEKAYLPFIGNMLKQKAVSITTTSNTIDVATVGKLKERKVDAVICANTATLQNLVQASTKSSVTLDGFRGSLLQFPTPVVVVNSLVHVKSVKWGKWLLGRDLDKLDHLQTPIELPTFEVLENEFSFKTALTQINNADLLSIDIETDQYARITCISFTAYYHRTRETKSFLIPFHDFGTDHFARDADFATAIFYLRLFCKTPVPKVMFNAGYDASYLIRYHAEPVNLVIDVMGLAHSRYSELPKTLDFVCSLEDPTYVQWKHEAALARKLGDIRSYWYYCVKDSFNTLKAGLRMWETYPEYARRNYQMKFKLTYPCLYTAFEGVKIDAEVKQQASETASESMEQALQRLRIMASDPNFNPSSPAQVSTLIYKIIGARPIKGTSTDAKVLDQIGEQHPILHRICKAIIEYREQRKAHSTYFNFKEMSGRLLYNMSPFATDTGRNSSHASNFYVGVQIQNIPPYAKNMCVADEGFELFEADNSKSEARIVARTSRCATLDTVISSQEKDFYKALATIFFGIPYEEVSNALRNEVVKRIVHGTNYMMGVSTFIEVCGVGKLIEGARMLGYPLKTVKDFAAYLLQTYHRRFPEVSKHYEEIYTTILTTGRMVSVLGYTRIFFGDIAQDHSKAILRGAVAHEPQNLSVDILNKGFWKVYKLVLASGGDLRLKAQIHDSNFGQARKEKIDYYRPLILEAMRNPVTIHGRELIIPVEWKQGPNWATMK